jgi:hypothetical protein
MAEQSSDLDDAAAAASYLASMSAELSKIARRHRFDVLGYLLDMARLEAENTGRALNGGGPR